MAEMASTTRAVDCGSLSVKFAHFAWGETLARRQSRTIECIGLEHGWTRARDADGANIVGVTSRGPDCAAALTVLLETLTWQPAGASLRAVGHRVVHGGAECDCPILVNEHLEARPGMPTPLAPLHLRHNLAGMSAVREARPDLPQKGSFDTASHQGLPRSIADKGIRRYGIRGLSYGYCVAELPRRHGFAVARERIVIAHLGNGAFMAAVRNGRSVETAIDLGALGGVPMWTRSADLELGLVLFLMLQRAKTTAADLTPRPGVGRCPALWPAARSAFDDDEQTVVGDRPAPTATGWPNESRSQRSPLRMDRIRISLSRVSRL